MMAFVGSSIAFHPEIDPSSATKMKVLGCELPFFMTLKNGVPFATIPVGLPPSLLLALGGIVMTSPVAVPSRLYSVDTPAPLSLMKMVFDEECAMPQGLTKFGSLNLATPGRSETKLTELKSLLPFPFPFHLPKDGLNESDNTISPMVITELRVLFIWFPFPLIFSFPISLN